MKGSNIQDIFLKMASAIVMRQEREKNSKRTCERGKVKKRKNRKRGSERGKPKKEGDREETPKRGRERRNLK